MTRAVFLGSPDAAVPALERLADFVDFARVITQPDRPRGRSGELVPTPVKSRAKDMGLSVAEPDSNDQVLREIANLGEIDIGVVVAYGRLLKPAVFDAPKHGILNIHFSLLPRWRGAAPVNRAIMAGDPMSGVTIIKIDAGLDTGPVANAQAIDVGRTETATELTERLARLGADLMARSLPQYLNGEIKAVPQTDDGATYAQKLDRADRPIDITMGTTGVINHVRGLAETPGATLIIDGETHKVLEVAPSDEDVTTGEWRHVDGIPVIAVGDGAVEIVRLQAPGKTVISGANWVRGRHAGAGTIS